MEAVGRLRHHATGKYGFGHTILKVSLYYRGVTIPWASLLYIKQEHAGKLKVPFYKLTELAGQAIRQAALPEKFKVTVLFDAFYVCPNVVDACKERKWHYIAVGKSNRWFTVGSVKRKLARIRQKRSALHLVDCAYACLTHIGIKAYCAQGQNKSKKVLRLEPISKLKDRMRRFVWQENVQDVIKYSHEKPVIRRLEKLLAA